MCRQVRAPDAIEMNKHWRPTWCLWLCDALVHLVLYLPLLHLLPGHAAAQLVGAVVGLGGQRGLEFAQEHVQAVTDPVQLLDGGLVCSYFHLEGLWEKQQEIPGKQLHFGNYRYWLIMPCVLQQFVR